MKIPTISEVLMRNKTKEAEILVWEFLEDLDYLPESKVVDSLVKGVVHRLLKLETISHVTLLNMIVEIEFHYDM